MNLENAKSQLNKVINKSRLHFYKPFQIAEILSRHRTGELTDLSDVDSYRIASRRWRDDVSNRLVGRRSSSSARYQDNIFDANACPPAALVALGAHNKATGGEVEVYIYRRFEAKVAIIGSILTQIRQATPATFDLSEIVNTFEMRPGLKRSIDKVFEIMVYALFSTVVRALRLEVCLTVRNTNKELINQFGDFLEKVVGLKKGTISLVLPASLFRLGSTNAADRGLDMIANFGPAIQVKHLTLDTDAIADICDGLTADRIVIVCKDIEALVLDAVIKQLGLADRLQSVVTFSDLLKWYGLCLSPAYRTVLGTPLLADFLREFLDEFPSLDGELAGFMQERGYVSISLSTGWVVTGD